jgi:hypothetical protein
MAEDRGASQAADMDPPLPSDAGRDAIAYRVLSTLAVAFSSTAPTRDDLVICALRHRMPPPIITALRALPDRRYGSPQELHADLLRQR